MKERIIFHIDCNNAFLSWTAVNMLHQGKKIDIRKRYAVIGGKESERKGIVLAKSPLCKQCQVVTGEPLYLARKKCPYLEVYPPEFEIYKKYSDIMYIYLCNYVDKIERYSIDECFMDFSKKIETRQIALKVAYQIKEDIKKNFGFTVNIGIGNNKLLAKMASDFEKPDKVHTLFINEIKDKMWPLSVDNLFMIGKSCSRKLHDLGIDTIKDLANSKMDLLVGQFKSMGKKMWEFANGIDNSEVEDSSKNPKSISHSMILPYNFSDISAIYKEIKKLSQMTGKDLREKRMYALNVTIWIKFSDFTKISRQVTLENLIKSDEDIYENAIRLFNKVWNKDKKVRALCVGVTGLTDIYNVQLSLLEKNEENIQNNNLHKVIHDIKGKYGGDSINFIDK